MDNKIKSFISSPENQYLERKSARVEPLDILKHLVAFANADGGSLVIGVEDNLKKLINKDIYKKLNLIEKEIIKFSFMNKKITTTDLTKKLNKSGLTTRKYLKKLVELGILEWHGTSARDPKQYYTLKK